MGETLFSAAARRDPVRLAAVPLAERMRPRTLGDLVGQAAILGADRLLAEAIRSDRVPSMILWGPPGVGKTTLGRIIAEETKAAFEPFSAVLGNLQELRTIIGRAKDRLAFGSAGDASSGVVSKRTIVFVDEIHRFNKAQQDAFLPHVEDGTITLIGATTENPSFSVNAALLSRCRVFHFEPIDDANIVVVLERALRDSERGLGAKRLVADPDALTAIAHAARGDVRRALSMLEAIAGHLEEKKETALTLKTVDFHDEPQLLYDKTGEEHYNVISAFIKSMRSTDPDAAVYWMMRMLEAGEDPLFILRRLLIFASEDIGNADPRAILIAAAADHTFQRVGMPEGLYALAHAATYLACAPKSNAAALAWQRAKELISDRGSLPVPKKLRNAVTPLMREEGYGTGYKYAHNFEGGVVPGETSLPDELVGARLYEPSERGFEAEISARLKALRREPAT